LGLTTTADAVELATSSTGGCPQAVSAASKAVISDMTRPWRTPVALRRAKRSARAIATLAELGVIIGHPISSGQE
jgi:hypothetical protein